MNKLNILRVRMHLTTVYMNLDADDNVITLNNERVNITLQ